MAPKIVTVYGATGAQGGSVARSLLANTSKSFAVRAITRNPSGDVAKALAEAGAEVVQADGLKKDEMIEALKGSWAVFVNTNSDCPTLGQDGGPTETSLGKGIVDAAVEAGVQVFVYSGMASATEVTKGHVPAPAFDEKHAIGEYAKTKPFKSVALVSPGWYMENYLVQEVAPLFGGFPFTPDSEGYLTMSCPRWGGNEEVPFISISSDYGDLVHGVLLDPEAYNGQMIHGLSASITLEQTVSNFEKATGKKSRFIPMENWKDFPTYGLRPMETVRDMFGFCQFSGGMYYGVPNDVVLPAKLKKAAAEAQGKTGEECELMTMEKFFKAHFSS